MAHSLYTAKQISRELAALRRMAKRNEAKRGLIPTFGEWYLTIHEHGTTLNLPYTLPGGLTGLMGAAL